jgi:hypothetical protein
MKPSFMTLGAALILSLAFEIRAQIPQLGRCPDIPVVENFDAKFVREISAKRV